jgi:hypothetical protein
MIDEAKPKLVASDAPLVTLPAGHGVPRGDRSSLRDRGKLEGIRDAAEVRGRSDEGDFCVADFARWFISAAKYRDPEQWLSQGSDEETFPGPERSLLGGKVWVSKTSDAFEDAQPALDIAVNMLRHVLPPGESVNQVIVSGQASKAAPFQKMLRAKLRGSVREADITFLGEHAKTCVALGAAFYASGHADISVIRTALKRVIYQHGGLGAEKAHVLVPSDAPLNETQPAPTGEGFAAAFFRNPRKHIPPAEPGRLGVQRLFADTSFSPEARPAGLGKCRSPLIVLQEGYEQLTEEEGAPPHSVDLAVVDAAGAREALPEQVVARLSAGSPSATPAHRYVCWWPRQRPQAAWIARFEV